jgi:hypothetical protein
MPKLSGMHHHHGGPSSRSRTVRRDDTDGRSSTENRRAQRKKYASVGGNLFAAGTDQEADQVDSPDSLDDDDDDDDDNAEDFVDYNQGPGERYFNQGKPAAAGDGSSFLNEYEIGEDYANDDYEGGGENQFDQYRMENYSDSFGNFESKTNMMHGLDDQDEEEVNKNPGEVDDELTYMPSDLIKKQENSKKLKKKQSGGSFEYSSDPATTTTTSTAQSKPRDEYTDNNR